MNLRRTGTDPSRSRAPTEGRTERRAITRLTELLAAVWASRDDEEALAHGARHVATALDAEIVGVLLDGDIAARALPEDAPISDTELASLTSRDGEEVTVAGLGTVHVSMVPLPTEDTALVVGRTAGVLDADEVRLVRELEDAFALGRRMARAAREERQMREQSELQARESLRLVNSLREAQRARELFLATVSHELKTPLTVIMGTLRTLEGHASALPEDIQTSLLAPAFQRGRDLERLIDRLLRGAKAELASEPVPARLPDLITRAVQGFEASRRLVRGTVPDLDLLIDVDAVRGVLGILLENAVTHAPVGTEVGIDTRVEGKEVLVAVRNAGTLPDGLDSRSLFEPFQRGPGATSSGVGLGLSIASRLARSAGGRIDVESAAGQVTFTLRLPQVPRPADGPR